MGYIGIWVDELTSLDTIIVPPLLDSRDENDDDDDDAYDDNDYDDNGAPSSNGGQKDNSAKTKVAMHSFDAWKWNKIM